VKVDLSKGFWNPKLKKIGGNHAFSEINELKVGKKMQDIVLCFKTFLEVWLLNYL